MLFLHLLNRMNSTAKTSQQREFLLDFQQPFLPLPVSNMRLRILSPFLSVPLVQFLKLCNFGPKPGNLFAKNLEMLHPLRIAFREIPRRRLIQAQCWLAWGHPSVLGNAEATVPPRTAVRDRA